MNTVTITDITYRDMELAGIDAANVRLVTSNEGQCYVAQVGGRRVVFAPADPIEDSDFAEDSDQGWRP